MLTELRGPCAMGKYQKGFKHSTNATTHRAATRPICSLGIIPKTWRTRNPKEGNLEANRIPNRFFPLIKKERINRIPDSSRIKSLKYEGFMLLETWVSGK